MFDDVSKKEPEDMFSEVESGVPRPPTPRLSTPSAPTTHPAEGLQMEQTTSSGGFPWRPLVVVLAVIVVIGAAGGISYYILSSRTPVTPGAPNVSQAVPETTTTPTTNTTSTVPVVNTVPTTETTPETVSPVEVDTDGDGLADRTEQELGTSPTNVDTDADKLFDREEVEVYHTNPLNPDTDSDGYLDGDEVKNQYNPNGPGKLFDVPSK